MADKEYSSDFKIIQRYGGGVCVVTNKLSLSILTLLISRDINLTELSTGLGVSKTTVQANLCRLEEDGIIASYPDENDNRSIRYCSTFIPVFSSGRLKEWENADYSKVVRDLYTEDAHVERDSLMFYACKLNDHNIRWNPFMISVGTTIGSELMSRGADLEDLEKLMSETYSAEVSELSMEGGLHMRLRSKDFYNMELVYLGYAVLGSLLHILFKQKKVKYSMEPRITFVNDYEYVFESDFTGSCFGGVGIPDAKSRGDRYHELKDRFAIYQPRHGDSILVKNAVMLDIMDCVSKEPKTVNDISTELGMKPVTVNASINKMLMLEFMEAADRSGIRNLRYGIIAEKILEGDARKARTLPENLRSFICRFLDGEVNLFEAVYDIHYLIVTNAGIRYDSILRGVGRDVALEVVKQNPGMTAMEFLALAPRLYKGGQEHTRLKSYVPLEFEIELEPGNVDFDLETSYFQSLIKEGLRVLTGVDYPVWFTKVDKVDKNVRSRIAV